MRVSGPISVQRVRPAPGWTTAQPRVAWLCIGAENPPVAATLPPQQRGDAACLTLLMAQTYGAGARPAGRYGDVVQDDGPIFAIRA